MAHIDNLINSIKDPQLRVALRAEYEKVTKSRRLGLVFDRHLPESVVLPGFTIREGEKVQILLGDGSEDPTELDGSGVWTVTKAGAKSAQLRDKNGECREVPTAQLVTAREFGDPIYPGLVSTGRVVRGGGAGGDDGGKPFHTVINSENYHALEALLFAYEGQVDAIYIDPPYNTGARDWKYNNDYVDDADPYRHSKWLSFIERRLILAKRLLNPKDSVLIVTIDEKEYLRLGLLLEQVFANARITMVTSSINAGGSTRTGTFARSAEYLFFVQVGASHPAALPLDEEWNPVKTVNKQDLYWNRLIRSGTQPFRTTHPNLFYPVFIRNTADGPVFDSVGQPFYGEGWRNVAAPPGCAAVWPIRQDGREGRWQISAEALRELIALGYARIGTWKDAATSLSYLKQGERKKVDDGLFPVTGHRADGSVITDGSGYRARYVPNDIWRLTSHDAGNSGSRLLARFLPDRTFPFAKALYAVEDALRFFVIKKTDALILDFFAGSGTTAHAVMRLNRQDGGKRRSICVTNNEVGAAERAALLAQGLKPGDEAWEALGICDYITKPRIHAAITGTTSTGEPVKGDYRFIDEFPMADGFEENAEFFTLTYEDPALVTLGRRFEAIAPLLWLRAGATGERIDRIPDEGWAMPPAAVYGVLFDTNAWGPFVAAAALRDDLVHAFIVTDSLVEYQQIIAKLDPALKTTRLYADYVRSFEINIRA
ncbi:DNA methyltransferase [Micromonospora sp. NPDC048170]|uniref:site-specific DNA-methyltransferase n=1 Tax=Micromonospora sp. NPDC048170 TaxID=3154819 RepID=UPI0033C48076